ncbi:unnamed protein product, partial [Rotaria sp. Silwood2]
SPSVRKTHCQGRKHKENVRDYYQKWMEEQAQKLVCVFSLYSCYSVEDFGTTAGGIPMGGGTPGGNIPGGGRKVINAVIAAGLGG